MTTASRELAALTKRIAALEEELDDLAERLVQATAVEQILRRAGLPAALPAAKRAARPKHLRVVRNGGAK